MLNFVYTARRYASAVYAIRSLHAGTRTAKRRIT